MNRYGYDGNQLTRVTSPGVTIDYTYLQSWLGNFTFGYICAAAGFSIGALYADSFYAAPLGTSAQIRDELFNDWPVITRGYTARFFGWRRRP